MVAMLLPHDQQSLTRVSLSFVRILLHHIAALHTFPHTHHNTTSTKMPKEAADYKDLVQDSEEEEDLYTSSQDYRLWFGPSIERYGDSGISDCLIGLTMEMKFVSCEETCRGVVKSCKQDSNSGDDQLFQVMWTCGDDPEEYSSELYSDAIIAWHFFTHNQEPPTWFDARLSTMSTHQIFQFSLSPSSKLVNFHLPCQAEQFFPSVKDDADGRWLATTNRLNDPDVPPSYFGGKLKSYPLSLLLTVIAITKDDNPSTILPFVIDPDNKVFKLTDQFTRSLSGSERSELAAVNKLLQLVAVKAEQVKDDDDWNIAYEHVQALILTLSRNFESAHSSWTILNSSEPILKACAKIVVIVGGVLLLHPPSPACKVICERDKAFLGEYLMTGSFVSPIGDHEDDFEEDHPVASGILKILQEEYEQ
jgi:hypothetical protein